MNDMNIEDYLLYCMENELAENTIKNYRVTLNQLFKWLQDNTVEYLKKNDLIKFKQFLKAKQYKVDTINHKIDTINIFLTWQHKDDMKLKMLRQQSNSHRASINQNEYRRLLKHSSGELNLFILTIGNTGLRISEVCRLKKQDLYQKNVIVNNKGKTRIIGIPGFVKKKLKTFVALKNDDAVIFGKTQFHYRQALKRCATKAMVDKTKVYPHSLRHYFAKQFIADGGDSTELQQMLGHASIQTTTIYTHLDSDELSRKFKQIKNL